MCPIAVYGRVDIQRGVRPNPVSAELPVNGAAGGKTRRNGNCDKDDLRDAFDIHRGGIGNTKDRM
jgi:hypothetical protein